ncbi:MAG: hypothetical protein BWY55_00492 [archaeon ADurb.Bin336]|nr:MAG: hypothetical protein BWY55_00492 [archaeon ADurb.Bin336]
MVFLLNKALIVYYDESSFTKPKNNQQKKVSNEEKVVLELKKLLEEKKFLVDTLNLVPTKKLHLKDQFKKEKEITLSNKMPELNNYKLVLIGTPIVGAMTSSPVINSFIRKITFNSKKTKPLFVMYSTGILHGFELKKLTSLLSMKGIKPIDSASFCSMFEFDSKKLVEVKNFFNRFFEKI